MKKVVFLFIALIAIISFSCSNRVTKTSDEPIVSTGVGVSGPDAIIYKTKNDYNLMVPVIMNAEKTDIVSYPAPGDLKYKGKTATPTLLDNGYLLDNRGITENVAFLSITYEEYMALDKSPQKEELLSLIIDNDPLIEMFNCGKRATFKNETEDLNALISKNDFSAFKKLK